MPVGEGAKRRTGFLFWVMIGHPFSKRFSVSIDPLFRWRFGAAPAVVLAPWRALLTMAEAERSRWPLWLPVFLGAGTALYFAWPREPSGLLALGILAIAIVAGLAARRWPALAL